MHAADKEELDQCVAGDIVAMVGVECASGDTYCAEGINVAMESIYVPEPVIDLAITGIVVPPGTKCERRKTGDFVMTMPTAHAEEAR